MSHISSYKELRLYQAAMNRTVANPSSKAFLEIITFRFHLLRVSLLRVSRSPRLPLSQSPHLPISPSLFTAHAQD